MPYITPHRRDRAWDRGSGDGPATPGELTYVLYRTVLEYIDGARAFGKFAEVLGAIEACKLELYRCEVAPYENQKRIENGSV